MEYRIYRKNIASQFIDLELKLDCIQSETVELQLPAWRPGRYELANYAQKLRGLKVIENGKDVPLIKVTKDLWTFVAPQSGHYRIHYQYYASQMDGGGSWSDDEQLYINFINLIFQIKGREHEEIAIKLEIPANYQLATALPSSEPFVLKAKDFHHLVDSPLIASPTLKHHQYRIDGHTFHLWFQGEIHFEIDPLITQFAYFTKEQIAAFGEFPAEDYHFLFQLLPYEHYHGVEHQFSTVITLGPAKDLKNKIALDRLMGVSSHELYHFWNVCRIRPKKLLPYDFSKEAYINSGVVAEGVTTYMGDLFLWKSGYYSTQEYLKIVEKLINREFEQFGWKNQSIVDSSLDLWLDGYKAGIPNKKVSIYNRGALIALCLDLMLLNQHQSLSGVMKTMWVDFGQKGIGYKLEDFQSLIGQGLKNMDAAEKFFNEYIYGTKDLLPLLQTLLQSQDILLTTSKRNDLATNFGLILDEAYIVKSIHPESPAHEKIMIGDVIQKQTVCADEKLLMLSLNRNQRILTVELPETNASYFKQYHLHLNNSSEQLSGWKKQ